MAAKPRHVLVTGGSRGIGLAIAQLFAKNSYRCTLISRSEQDLKTAVASLHPLPSQPPSASKDETASSSSKPDVSEPENPTISTQHQHGYVAGDLSHGTKFWHADQPFRTQFPRPDRNNPATHSSQVDVLVNCAGLTQAKLFGTLDDSAMENIIDTNLTALMQGTKFLLRYRYLRSLEKEHDHFSPVIINVASLLGLQGGYGAVAYAASKAGVLGFTRALATEYASHKVRVNAVVPGYVDTDMTKGMLQDYLLS